MQRRIYVLKNLTPEVKAVCFAKCSRSPKPFDEIARELTEEKSSEFHEKWVVGYGHSSVAEHAVLSIAIEDVSILATKVIEDNRLASYTEKSTRYQVYDREKYYRDPAGRDWLNPELRELYIKTGDFLMDTYLAMEPIMREFIVKKYPRKEDELTIIYNSKIKAKICDNIRYLLPTATLTNLGMTMNARNLEYAIVKLLSHPLQEMRDIGQEIKQSALQETPTLIKYTEPNQYLIETEKSLQKLSREKLCDDLPENNKPVILVDYEKDAGDKIATALLYRYSQKSYEHILCSVKKMSKQERKKIIDEALKLIGRHDRPLRELEHIYYTFDILMDYGAFRDIQRHRIATQTNQLVTIENGYDVPAEIIEAGLGEKFKEVMEKSMMAFNKIRSEYFYEAQYIVPLAFKKRTLFTWNLRELHHFIKLRSGKMGHDSYRKIAQLVYSEVIKVHPFLGSYIRVDKGETGEHVPS